MGHGCRVEIVTAGPCSWGMRLDTTLFPGRPLGEAQAATLGAKSGSQPAEGSGVAMTPTHVDSPRKVRSVEPLPTPHPSSVLSLLWELPGPAVRRVRRRQAGGQVTCPGPCGLSCPGSHPASAEWVILQPAGCGRFGLGGTCREHQGQSWHASRLRSCHLLLGARPQEPSGLAGDVTVCSFSGFYYLAETERERETRAPLQLGWTWQPVACKACAPLCCLLISAHSACSLASRHALSSPLPSLGFHYSGLTL